MPLNRVEPACPRGAAASRRGFTLIELLFTLVVLNVAILSLVAGGTIVVQRSSDLRARAAAIEAANNRIQHLAAGPCRAVADSATDRGIEERWTAVVDDYGIRALVDSVSFDVRGTAHTLVLRTRVPC